MKTRRTQPWLILAALVIAAPILSGCTGASTVLTASWPGLSVQNDTVYLSFARVYAFNADGTAKWSFPDPEHQLASNQAFFAPPATDANLVVVTDYTDKVFGLDPASGTQLWYFKSNNARFIGGPVMNDKRVYAATADGIIHAIDRDTKTPSPDGDVASEAWSYRTEGSIWSTPLLAGDTLYVTSMDKHVYALDAATGELQWKYPDETSAPEDPPLGGIVGTPTLHDGVLYFGSFNNRLYALDVETRKVLWRYETTNWVWGSPVVEETTGYVIAADLDGNIFAIDPASSTPGEQVWQISVKPVAVGSKVAIVGSPALGTLPDGTPVVYVGSDGNPNLYVLKVKDGANALHNSPKAYLYTTPGMFLFFPTGVNNPDAPIKIYASPALAGDTLYIATSEGPNALYILDSNTLEYKTPDRPPIALKDVDIALKSKGGPAPSEGEGGLFGNPQTLLLMAGIFLLVTLVLRPGRGKK